MSKLKDLTFTQTRNLRGRVTNFVVELLIYFINCIKVKYRHI